MVGFEYILLAISILLLLSIAIARATNNIGVPTLILFLAVGMLAGSDGPGGIEFSDTALAQSIGAIALMLIL
ncbi:potassium/proton antiporter, partial [Klebsiella pneumoniae]